MAAPITHADYTILCRHRLCLAIVHVTPSSFLPAMPLLMPPLLQIEDAGVLLSLSPDFHCRLPRVRSPPYTGAMRCVCFFLLSKSAMI
jgi:hypothetical protein